MHATSRTRSTPAPVRRVLTLMVLIGVALAVLVSMTAPVGASTLSRNQRIQDAFTVAKRQIGDPYHYGSAGPSRFDCSGLLYFSFHRAGFDGLPRTSRDQARFARHIRRSHLRKGDFIFFTNSSGTVYHVAIFVGWKNHRRIILHAPEPGRDVQRDKVFSSRWFAATLRKRA